MLKRVPVDSGYATRNEAPRRGQVGFNLVRTHAGSEDTTQRETVRFRSSSNGSRHRLREAGVRARDLGLQKCRVCVRAERTVWSDEMLAADKHGVVSGGFFSPPVEIGRACFE